MTQVVGNFLFENTSFCVFNPSGSLRIEPEIKIMLIEYFTQWLENTATRQDSVQPDVIDDSSKENTKKTVIQKVVIHEKFKDDIQELFEFKCMAASRSVFLSMMVPGTKN